MDTVAFAERLICLYERQLESSPSAYLRAHAGTRGAVLRQVEAAKLYLPYVTGRVLDWGCMHGVDACLIRMQFGSQAEIHGCDVLDPAPYAVFHEFADMRYRQLRHPYLLPYPDDYFDAVIADGVIEHVPNDAESLKELYRVLKRDGLIVFSCVPNARSYSERLAAVIGLPHHLRRYRMSEFRSQLLHSGFEPVYLRYLQMVPTLSGAGACGLPGWLGRLSSALWPVNPILESLWPLNRLSSNLFVMARKRQSITSPGRLAA